MSPSQESAQPQHPRPQPADPLAGNGGLNAGQPGDSVSPAPWAASHDGGQRDDVAGGGSPWARPAAGDEAGQPPMGYGLAHPSGPLPDFAEPGRAARWWGFQRTTRRPVRRTIVVTVAVALTALVLGGPLGLLWRWLAPSVPVVDNGRDVVVNDPSPEEYIAADGWFTLLGLGFGLLVAIVAWLVLRRDRGPFLLLGVVAGTLGAGWLVAPWVGELIGRDDYEQWRATAAQGATYLAPPEVHSVGPTLVPAFAAAIVLTLLAGWSNDPDLEHPGAKPGYGPNQAAAEAYAWEQRDSSPPPVS